MTRMMVSSATRVASRLANRAEMPFEEPSSADEVAARNGRNRKKRTTRERRPALAPTLAARAARRNIKLAVWLVEEEVPITTFVAPVPNM
mmetsp:Transcript_10234/g.23077  ORF Transcript_10234/g.23077 Transcript_10234/m.23077 type:complete len:90 (-) Transcript_10234:430-699(-)